MNMADFLSLTIKKDVPAVSVAYWWPIIFEGMHRASFQFYDPRQATKQGSYFLSESIAGTFQDLWELLFLQNGSPLVAFWFSAQGTDTFCCEVSVHEEGNNAWTIDFTVEDGQLWQGEMKGRFSAFLQAGLALYELCAPCAMQMYWDEEFTSDQLMQVRSVMQQEPLDPGVFCSEKLAWKEIACINETRILIPNPMPIHVGGREGFRWLPLE